MPEVMLMWFWSQRVSQDDPPVFGISYSTICYMWKTYKYTVTCLVTTWKESLLDIMKGFLWPDNFAHLSLVSPVTEPLMSEKLKPVISTLECLNDFTEVWLSNLFFDCLINHWPECWGFPVDILALSRITFWGFVWLANFLLFFLFECCGDKLFGMWGSSNLLVCWEREIRCGCILKTMSI